MARSAPAFVAWLPQQGAWQYIFGIVRALLVWLTGTYLGRQAQKQGVVYF